MAVGLQEQSVLHAAELHGIHPTDRPNHALNPITASSRVTLFQRWTYCMLSIKRAAFYEANRAARHLANTDRFKAFVVKFESGLAVRDK